MEHTQDQMNWGTRATQTNKTELEFAYRELQIQARDELLKIIN